MKNVLWAGMLLVLTITLPAAQAAETVEMASDNASAASEKSAVGVAAVLWHASYEQGFGPLSQMAVSQALAQKGWTVSLDCTPEILPSNNWVPNAQWLRREALAQAKQFQESVPTFGLIVVGRIDDAQTRAKAGQTNLQFGGGRSRINIGIGRDVVANHVSYSWQLIKLASGQPLASGTLAADYGDRITAAEIWINGQRLSGAIGATTSTPDQFFPNLIRKSLEKLPVAGR